MSDGHWLIVSHERVSGVARIYRVGEGEGAMLTFKDCLTKYDRQGRIKLFWGPRLRKIQGPPSLWPPSVY
ncbi:hypothetical protein DPMN_119959 [Dreissena polymorpha]|uniref:Uncharacterized protein n=1 Tax=Dreissena polymorpha TaxID=45954 RepID=A0A9D4GK72_DREPO|nr:hypothetical protein DPMN_119959 [Dreissena polymorpha]